MHSFASPGRAAAAETMLSLLGAKSELVPAASKAGVSLVAAQPPLAPSVQRPTPVRVRGARLQPLCSFLVSPAQPCAGVYCVSTNTVTAGCAVVPAVPPWAPPLVRAVHISCAVSRVMNVFLLPGAHNPVAG